MTAKDDDTNKNEPVEVQAGHVPNLDEINDLTQHKLEQEGDDEFKPEEPKDEEPDEEPKEKDTTPEEEPADDDQPTETPAAPEPATELDEDILKPGKDKVAIKDFEGKTFYFNSLDEVPDTFEPASYKALMVGVDSLRTKAENDQKAAELAQENERKAEVKERTNELQKSWDADIKELDLTDQKEIDAVYTYMEKELKKGKVIDNFSVAYRAVQYDKIMDERAAEEKELGDRKKARGSRVQPGGTTQGSKPIEKQAPPQGLSLDQVHAKVLHDLP